MRIIITGSQGFLGGNFAKYIQERTNEVVRVDARDGADVVLNICDLDPILDLIQQDDIIFHFAAVADARIAVDNPYLAYYVNYLGTLNVLEAARRTGSTKVIVASSNWVYSAAVNAHSQEEAYFNSISTNHPYTASKVCTEFLISGYSNQGVRATIIRPFNPYGPSMWNGLVIQSMIDKASKGENVIVVGDGLAMKSFLHVDDLNKALELLISPISDGETYNLCSDEHITILDLAKKISSLYGVGIEHRDDLSRRREHGQPSNMFNAQKMYNHFSWQPSVRLDDGLKDLMQMGEKP